MRSYISVNRPSTWVVVLVLVAAAGCIEREGRPVNPCTNVTIGQQISVTNVDKVDLLFMVDNSNSMMQEQASLTAEFPRLVSILASGDFNQDGDRDDDEDFNPVNDLNIGVITSDMGTGGFSVPTCLRSDFGDDGVLRQEGRADISGCMAMYPPFLNFRPDQPGADPNQFATDVSCVATVGTGGCGFEQQLEAMLKAASPSAPTAWTADAFVAPTFFQNTFGHADRGNDGFIREGSVLALVPVTDEEDCSARPSEVELFNQESSIYTAELNLRCFAHADAALHTIDRYVEGFINLRRRPGLLIYAPIVGIPVDLVPATGERPDYARLFGPSADPRMVQQVDPVEGDQLVPSCNIPGRGVAFPPVRIVQVAEQLQNRDAGVTVQSICQDDFSGALLEIINQIKSALGQACLPRDLNVQADGSVNCDVLSVMPADTPCTALAGSSPRLIEGVPEIREGNRAVCVVDQLVGSAATGEPEGDGWYYDSFTAEVATNCGAEGQRIAFKTQPPSGADIELQCFQSVNTVGEGDVTIGTFCDPADAANVCGGGLSPVGEMPLNCDPVLRTCGVPCTDDSVCRAAGLVGFVCDTRPISEVDPSSESPDTYGQCVNPTC